MKAWIARQLGSLGRRWARRAAIRRVQLEDEYMERLERQASLELGLEPIPRMVKPDKEQMIEDRTEQILEGDLKWP